MHLLKLINENEVDTACEKHGSLSILRDIVSVKYDTVVSFVIRKIKRKEKIPW